MGSTHFQLKSAYAENGMASGIIQNPSEYEQGTWTVGSDPDCTLSANNEIYRIGRIAFVRLIITGWGDKDAVKTRTLYTNLSIPPTKDQSIGLYLKASSGIQTAAINISSSAKTITLRNDGAFTNTTVRMLIT